MLPKTPRIFVLIVLVASVTHATSAMHVPGCCDSRWTGNCSTLETCPNLVQSATLMRMKLYEDSSGSVLQTPIDTQNLWVELKWDWNESSRVNITAQNANLTLDYFPNTTWLVIAFGSSIHPAVWLNVSASLGFIDSNIRVTEHTVIATVIEEYDPIEFGVILDPLRSLSAASLTTSSPNGWNSVTQNLWKFDIMLSDVAQSTSPSLRIGSCDASNVSLVANRVSCSFAYNPAYSMIIDSRFFLDYIYAGQYYSRGVFVAPSSGRSGSNTSDYSFLVSTGSQKTAALVSQPLNVTLTSSDGLLPSLLVDLSSFAVVSGSRSYECRRNVVLDPSGQTLRCLVPPNTLRVSPMLNATVSLFNNSVFISSQLNFTLVNQPTLQSSFSRRIAQNAAQLKIYGASLGDSADDLTQISANGIPCSLPYVWMSPTEIICNLPNATRLNMTQTVSVSAAFYNGDLRVAPTPIGYVVESPPRIIERTATTVLPPNEISLFIGTFSNWTLSDVTVLKLIWGTGFTVDCTPKAWMSIRGDLYCNTTSLDVIQADGNLLRAFAVIGGAPVGPASITYIALGVPMVNRASSLGLVSPWNRNFAVPGGNFYRVNASFNAATLEINGVPSICEGILVTAQVLRCTLSTATTLPLEVGDVVVREVISNGISSGSLRVRIAYVTLPPGYGLGPGFAPDGSPLQTGFGSLTSTILVIVVLSGLIVLVLLTFMILSGRTGGNHRAARSLFSTRAVGTVITLVQGPVPPRYQPLVPPDAEDDGDNTGSSSGSSSSSQVQEEDPEVSNPSSSEHKKKTPKSQKPQKAVVVEKPDRRHGSESKRLEESAELDSLNSDSEDDSEASDSGSES